MKRECIGVESPANKRVCGRESLLHWTTIQVSRDQDMVQQVGNHMFFDLVDHHHEVRGFCFENETPFQHFKEKIATEFDIPVEFQRYWLWEMRENHTYRPKRPLTPTEETQSVEQVRGLSNKIHEAELNLYLEVEYGSDIRPIPLLEKTEDDILLFLKVYESNKQELRFVGRLYVKANKKPSELVSKLNQMVDYALEQEIDLFKEVRFVPRVWCPYIKKNITFRENSLSDGDIVCFQKSPQVDSAIQYRSPFVSTFLANLPHRQVVADPAVEETLQAAERNRIIRSMVRIREEFGGQNFTSRIYLNEPNDEEQPFVDTDDSDTDL